MLNTREKKIDLSDTWQLVVRATRSPNSGNIRFCITIFNKIFQAYVKGRELILSENEILELKEAIESLLKDLKREAYGSDYHLA